MTGYLPHEAPEITMDGGEPVVAVEAVAPGALQPNETPEVVLSQPAPNVESDGTPHHVTLLPTGARRCIVCDEAWPCQRAVQLGQGDPSFGVQVTQAVEPSPPPLSPDELEAIRDILRNSSGQAYT